MIGSQNEYITLPPLGNGYGVLHIRAWRGLNDFFTRKTPIRAVELLTTHPIVGGSTVGVGGFSIGGRRALWLSQHPELPIGASGAFHGARAADYAGSGATFDSQAAESP